MEQKYMNMKRAICMKYERRCLTGKCPLAKFTCYDYPNVQTLYSNLNQRDKKKFEKALEEIALEHGRNIDDYERGVMLL